MISLLLSVHNALVPLVLTIGGLTVLCGIVTYVAQRRGEVAVGSPLALVARAFRVLLAITAATGVLQAIMGGLLVTQGCQPKENLHYVYGIIVLIAIPVAYVYSDQKSVRRDILIMTIAVVAIVGAAVRALATGPGGIAGPLCH